MGHIAEALKKAEHERAQRRIPGEPESVLSLAPILDGRLRVEPLPWGESAPAPDSRPNFSKLASHLNDVAVPFRAAGTSERPVWNIHPSIIAYHDRSSSIAEQYRAVRTWLLSHTKVGEHPCLAITSSVPREGKSVTAANLAVAMSEVRQMRILAVDCDLRQAGLGKLLHHRPSPGLAEVLAGNAYLKDAIHPTPLDNLFFLPAGDCGAIGPTELLSSTGAARVFEEIRDSFDYTLVDTPPVQQVSDVGVIGGLCTGVVMVVRMNHTDSQIVRQTLRWLQSNNLKVLGCIAAACSLKASLNSYRPTDDIE